MCSCHLAAAGPPPPGPPLGARGVGEGAARGGPPPPRRGLQCRRDATEEPPAPVIHMSDEGRPQPKTRSRLEHRLTGLTIFTNFRQRGARGQALLWMGVQTARTNREDECSHSATASTMSTVPTHWKSCAPHMTLRCSCFPHLQDHERARRRLALLILRHMDRGESERDIVNLALLDLLRVTQ